MTINVGALGHQITVEALTTVADGDGGMTETWAEVSLSPWWASIRRASQTAIERLFSSTVLAHATHIMSGRFNPDITITTRLSWTDRSGLIHQANVLDFDDVEGKGEETVVLCSEIRT